MSFSDATRRAAPLAALLAALALAGCTAGPLYGSNGIDPVTGAATNPLAELRGRIAVAGAPTRTAQEFRNAMLFRFNGSQAVRDPVYELRYTVTASDQVSIVENASGIPAANLYRMSVGYRLVRLSDGAEIANGTRFALAPYDRTTQVFAAQRALIDAREQAGNAVADRILGALAPVIQRETTRPTPSPALRKG